MNSYTHQAITLFTKAGFTVGTAQSQADIVALATDLHAIAAEDLDADDDTNAVSQAELASDAADILLRRIGGLQNLRGYVDVLLAKKVSIPVSNKEDIAQLSRAELKTLFHVGRKVKLVNCLLGVPKVQGIRTVLSQHSYGYRFSVEGLPDPSYLRFEGGEKVFGISKGAGFERVRIVTNRGEIAVEYELL